MMDALNGDLSRRVEIDTEAMPWSPSPSGTVWRKRLHRVGPAESGQVTSVVRYDARSSFPAHDHPDGEEILVLEGVFSDDAGDWPAGTYLLNPEGFRHAPSSDDGCVLFVKLRQYPGTARAHVVVATDEIPWKPGRVPGHEIKLLYSQQDFADTTWLERLEADTELPGMSYPGGAEVFVLDGELVDHGRAHRKHGWIRIPAGATLAPSTSTGCTFYLKQDGLQYLKHG